MQNIGKSSLQAGVAQLVEQRIRNAKVEGSTPFTGTTSPSPSLARDRKRFSLRPLLL